MENKYITFWDYKHKAEETQKVLDQIPEARLMNIDSVRDSASDGLVGVVNPQHIKAVVLMEDQPRVVAAVSRHYKIVQHKDAFAPIFKGLHNTATEYDFSLFQTDTKTTLNVYSVQTTENGNKGIHLGFSAISTIDGRGSIRYSFSQSTFDGVVEMVGYRQVCENGMKVRVDLKNAEFVEPEIKGRIEELLKLSGRVAHVGNPEAKVEAIQYVVEAMNLLAEPVKRIIAAAKGHELTEEHMKLLVKEYVGKRLNKRIHEQYASEEQSVWGLYNAITNVASHGVKKPTMNGMIDKAAVLLQEQVVRAATPATAQEGA